MFFLPKAFFSSSKTYYLSLAALYFFANPRLDLRANAGFQFCVLPICISRFLFGASVSLGLGPLAGRFFNSLTGCFLAHTSTFIASSLACFFLSSEAQDLFLDCTHSHLSVAA